MASRFFRLTRRKSAGILDVFQTFSTQSGGKRCCQTVRRDLIRVSQELLIFCANIRYLRDRNGLFKRDMASILGVGVNTITALEHNTVSRGLGSSVLIRMSRYFHVRTCELFRPLWK